MPTRATLRVAGQSDDEAMTVLFNPASLKVSLTNKLQDEESGSSGTSGGQPRQATRVTTTKLETELLFDSTQSGTRRARLHRLHQVSRHGARRRPSTPAQRRVPLGPLHLHRRHRIAERDARFLVVRRRAAALHDAARDAGHARGRRWSKARRTRRRSIPCRRPAPAPPAPRRSSARRTPGARSPRPTASRTCGWPPAARWRSAPACS